MNYSVEVTHQALSDLRAIYEYITFELKSPQSASSLLSRLENQIMALDTLPERHRIYGIEPWKSRKLRIMPVDNYCIFYIVNNDTLTVQIVRVMYGKRDREKAPEEVTN